MEENEAGIAGGALFAGGRTLGRYWTLHSSGQRRAACRTQRVLLCVECGTGVGHAAMPSPVLTLATLLRACYAVSGTDIGFPTGQDVTVDLTPGSSMNRNQ
eukprot:1154291-Rhodomonas_salina.1